MINVICGRQNEKLIDRSVDLSLPESRKIVDGVENAPRNAINDVIYESKLKINQPHNVDLFSSVKINENRRKCSKQ